MEIPDPSNENEERIFSLLLESGAIELIGLDETGEPTYKVTPKCEEVFPEFFEYHTQIMTETANELWHMGVIEMNFTAKGETVSFNRSNYARLQEVIDDLTENQITFLEALGAPIKRLR